MRLNHLYSCIRYDVRSPLVSSMYPSVREQRKMCYQVETDIDAIFPDGLLTIHRAALQAYHTKHDQSKMKSIPELMNEIEALERDISEISLIDIKK